MQSRPDPATRPGRAEAEPQAAPSGVIHDIGYRNYTGPRLGRAAVTRALFAYSLRGMYGLGRSARSKVLPFGLLAVMCLPALVLAVITIVGARQGLVSQPPLPYYRYAMTLQAAVAIFLAAQAPQVVSLDLRFQTVPLYFSRPLERMDYVAAKYGAVVAGVFILLAVPLVIMYAGALLAEMPVGRHTGDVILALAGALVFALVLSAVALVIAAATSRRGFAVAGIITVLALTFSMVSALQGIIGFDQGEMDVAGWLGIFSPMTLADGVQVWAFGARPSTVAGPPGGLAGAVFAVVAAALVAGSFTLLTRRYRSVMA